MDRPGSVDGRRPVGDRPGADLVRAGGLEADQPEEAVREGDDPVQAALGDAQLRAEGGGLFLVQLAELHLDPGRERVHERVPVVVASGDRRHELAGSREVALTHVQEDEDRLLGQEAEAPQGLLLVGIEPGVADRMAVREGASDSLEDHALPLVRLALGGRPVATRPAQPLQAPVDHGEVGQDELEVELLQVPPGVHGAGRVGMMRVIPGPDHVEQGVGVAEPPQVLGR